MDTTTVISVALAVGALLMVLSPIIIFAFH